MHNTSSLLDETQQALNLYHRPKLTIVGEKRLPSGNLSRSVYLYENHHTDCMTYSGAFLYLEKIIEATEQPILLDEAVAPTFFKDCSQTVKLRLMSGKAALSIEPDNFSPRLLAKVDDKPAFAVDTYREAFMHFDSILNMIAEELIEIEDKAAPLQDKDAGFAFYAVYEGFETGVFDSYQACKNATEHYSNAVFKRFNEKKEAERSYFAYAEGKEIR